jgi:hypothetical protein
VLCLFKGQPKPRESSAPGGKKKKQGDEFDVNSFLFYGGND